MSLRRLRILAIAGAVVVLALLVALSLIARRGIKQSADANGPAPLAIGTELQRPRPVPPVSLVDEQGKPFSLSAWHGKWVSDSSGDARSFLAKHPVSYPSYPASDLSPLAVLQSVPTTVFVSPAGKVVGVHLGQYGTEAALDNDINRYVLGARS